MSAANSRNGASSPPSSLRGLGWYLGAIALIGLVSPLLRQVGETVAILVVLALVGLAETAAFRSAGGKGNSNSVGRALARWIFFVAVAMIIYLWLSA